MISLLKSYYKLNGNPQEATAHIITDKFAQKHSHHIKWQRSGQKERIEESSRLMPAELQSVTAFDGQVQRTFHYQEGSPKGFIYAPERSNWFTMNRIHPFAILYVSFETFFSEIVEKGSDFRLKREMRGAESYVRVTVTHPAYESTAYELLFGKGGLLVERRLLLAEGKKQPRKWVVREITRLSDYRRHNLPEGEVIWFPHQAVITYCAGQMPDGRLVEWKTDTLRLNDIEFNKDIPEGTFTLEFPTDMPVYDGLTGEEIWLEPGVRPAAVFQPELVARRRLGWIVAGGVLATLAVIGALLLLARRRGRRAAPIR